MTSGTTYEFGDVVVAPFPFTSNLAQSKKRPLIVVSNTAYNAGTSDLVCCGVTSVLTNTWFSISIKQKDMESGNIPADSLIRYGHMFTLEKSLVSKVGGVDARVRSQVVKALAALFDGS